MLWSDPAQRPRIAEIRDDLKDRINEAERQGWLGEIEGLNISLSGATDKLLRSIDDPRPTTRPTWESQPSSQPPTTADSVQIQIG
ncbi:MAG: hypothetical protein WCG47_30445 [Dermatophilaceae bacterium]